MGSSEEDVDGLVTLPTVELVQIHAAIKEVSTDMREVKKSMAHLKDLPNSVDHLTDAIVSHRKVFETAVPLVVVKWIFMIVLLLVCSITGIGLTIEAIKGFIQ